MAAPFLCIQTCSLWTNNFFSIQFCFLYLDVHSFSYADLLPNFSIIGIYMIFSLLPLNVRVHCLGRLKFKSFQFSICIKKCLNCIREDICYVMLRTNVWLNMMKFVGGASDYFWSSVCYTLVYLSTILIKTDSWGENKNWSSINNYNDYKLQNHTFPYTIHETKIIFKLRSKQP